MTACPTCGHNPTTTGPEPPPPPPEPNPDRSMIGYIEKGRSASFAAERAAYYQSAWRGQRDLARDLARQLAALKEKRT